MGVEGFFLYKYTFKLCTFLIILVYVPILSLDPKVCVQTTEPCLNGTHLKTTASYFVVCFCCLFVFKIDHLQER